ncbi:MAG: uracil-DNA glycosylase [Deltaproteobacteria bacterium]|nr:uracil-DNA glycosylase [Deltaproteobacteria bacterium]MBW1793958.1 uracil-DNA glycosylase [Deltaproteobacteria bacterium]MBW2329726.1 uracil-DNA glycosylase [Deltaproteobacteria bacterium]
MIDCHRCKHYYVTWDKHFPHGCRAMKFKSKELPSRVVVRSSGIPCLLFEAKDRGGKMGSPGHTVG